MSTKRNGFASRFLAAWRALSVIVIKSIFLLVVYAHSNASAQEYIQEIVPFRDGMDFGIGYSTEDRKVRGECVSYESIGEPTEGGESSGPGRYRLKQIESASSFYRELGLSLRAAYSSLFTSVEGKADFFRAHGITTYDLNFLAAAEQAHILKRAKGPLLVESLVDIARDHPSQFRLKCGDSFVSGIKTGGTLFVLITLRTLDKRDHQKMSAQFDAAVGGFEASGSVSSDIASSLESSRLHVSGFKEGGSDTYSLTIEQATKELRAFPGATRDNPALVAVEIKDYRSLINFPIFGDEFWTDQETLREIVDLAWNYKTLLDDIGYIRRNRDQFVPYREASLDLIEDIIRNDFEELKNAARSCQDYEDDGNGASGCEVPDVPPPEHRREDNLPKRLLAICDTVELSDTEKTVAIEADQLAQGSGEIGDWPIVTISAEASVKRGSRVEIEGWIQVMNQDDNTLWDGRFRNRVFEAPDGCVIDEREWKELNERKGRLKQQFVRRQEGGLSSHRGLLAEADCSVKSGIMQCSLRLRDHVVPVINEELG